MLDQGSLDSVVRLLEGLVSEVWWDDVVVIEGTGMEPFVRGNSGNC